MLPLVGRLLILSSLVWLHHHHCSLHAWKHGETVLHDHVLEGHHRVHLHPSHLLTAHLGTSHLPHHPLDALRPRAVVAMAVLVAPEL